MPTIGEVLTPPTETESEGLILGSLRAFGLRTTAWQKFAIPRTTVELTKRLYPALRSGLANVVRERLTKLASGGGLDYLAEQWFELQRGKATSTVGTFVLADEGGAPLDVTAGSLAVRDIATGLIFTSAQSGTLSSGGDLPLAFKAEKPGAAHNITSNSDLELLDDDGVVVTGVSVTNPPDPTSGTWITTAGTDRQKDVALQADCDAQWDSPGCGDDAYYLQHIQEVVPEITKIRIIEGFDDFGESNGVLHLVLATDSGAPTLEMVDAATTVATRVRPVGLRQFTVSGAGEDVQAIVATVYVRADHATGYIVALDFARAAYQAEIQIDEDIYRSRVLAMLHAPRGVRHVDLTSPAGESAVVTEESIGRIDISGVVVENVM